MYPKDRWLFLTCHLHGCLPLVEYPPPKTATAGQAFAWADRYLDRAQSGPLYLKEEAIAKLVVESLLCGAGMGNYRLGAFVVMANHMHVLLFPLVPPNKLLQSLKGFTAQEANRLLGRTGNPFWQPETYDHWVRNDEEWRKIASYIENNPVKAGIVSRAEEYPWSSANET